MATSGYIGEIQPAAQSQGPGITVTPGQPDASSTPATAPQFLAEIQTAVATPTVVTATGQTTPTEQETSIATQKPAASSQAQSTAQAQSSQTQYVTAEIQGSPTQSGNAQCTPQYIVVTVTGKPPTSLTIIFIRHFHRPGQFGNYTCIEAACHIIHILIHYWLLLITLGVA